MSDGRESNPQDGTSVPWALPSLDLQESAAFRVQSFEVRASVSEPGSPRNPPAKASFAQTTLTNLVQTYGRHEE